MSHASREKGRLRIFLLGSLQHFLSHEHDRARALKRGGGQQVISLEEHLAAVEAAVHATSHNDAVSGYDQKWAATLANQAWERLRAACMEEGKEQWLPEMKPLVFGGNATLPRQEEIARRLNLSPSTLRTSLQRLRQRYRQFLREAVARTVSTPAEVDEEMQYLYRVLLS